MSLIGGSLARSGTSLRARYDSGYKLSDSGVTTRVFNVHPTSAGVDVNEHSMMSLSAVYRALHLWAEIMAHLPRHLYRREVGRGASPDLIASEHPLDWVLYRQPNPEQDAFRFWELMLLSWWIRGNAVAEIERDGAGRTIGLWWLDPRNVTRRPRPDGSVWYEVRLREGASVYLPRRDVFHVPQGGGLWGCGFVHHARRSLGVAMASDEYASSTYGNNGRPGGILKLASKHADLPDEAKDRLEKTWGESHQGLTNAQRVGILEEGMEWQDVGFNPEETQLLESRKYSVSEVARWTNLPEHLIGGLEKATFSNIDQQSLELIVYRVSPMAVRFEQAIDTQALAGSDKRDYYSRFNIDALLRGDPASRSEYQTKLFNAGALSPNDIRNLEDMPPYEGGDVYLIPLNMQPTQQAGLLPVAAGGDLPDLQAERSASPAPAPSRESIPAEEVHQQKPAKRVELRQREDSARNRSAVVRESRERFILAALRVAIEEKRRIDAATERLLRTTDRPSVEQKGIGAFEDWLRTFYDGSGDFRRWAVDEQLLPVFRALASELAGMTADEADGYQLPDSEVEDIAAWMADGAAFKRGASSQGQLTQLIAGHQDPDDLADAIDERTAEWVGDSSQREPRSNGEGLLWGKSISGGIVKATMAGAGVELLRWVSIGKSCPACESLDGKIVGLEDGEPFARKNERVGTGEGGQTQIKQRRDTFQPPLHGGCDCEITGG